MLKAQHVAVQSEKSAQQFRDLDEVQIGNSHIHQADLLRCARQDRAQRGEAGFSPRLAQPAPQVSSVINVVAAGLGVYIVPAAIAQVQVKGVRYVDVQGAKMRARLALGWREGDASAALGNLVGLL
ncbi:hypothetical protein FRZ40_33190 [Paraburkholderia azotifigens]|uniref:LysR substrate-binding domain-containing protein n=1 Tax=Paraburkholderia azotifigens TaxID=2057004 RepID=A0A5C6V271_9BURK|nr:hypothetical protein FRZ40_33190 [Paraburkholderia azotifigens]